MSRRPLPSISRGPRRSRALRVPARLLGCPRISPEWELAAMRALIKPQLKDKILHRPAAQPWTRSAKLALERARASLVERLGWTARVHLPPAGDYHFIAEVIDANSDESRASAVVLSRALPDLWLVAGSLFVKNGQFYRRQYGYKLWLVPATNIHLPRALRSALIGWL